MAQNIKQREFHNNFQTKHHTKNSELFFSLDYALDLVHRYLDTLKALKLMGKDIELKESPTLIHSSYWEASIFFVTEVQAECDKLLTTLHALKNQKTSDVVML